MSNSFSIVFLDNTNTKKMEIEPLTVEQSSRLMSNRFVFESRKNPNQLRGEKVTWALEGLNNTKILQQDLFLYIFEL